MMDGLRKGGWHDDKVIDAIESCPCHAAGILGHKEITNKESEMYICQLGVIRLNGLRNGRGHG